MYGKVFTQMYEGSLGSKGPWEALVTFQQLIVLSNKNGEVDMTPEAISRRTTIPLSIIQKGLEELIKPDPDSRTPNEEGRRIVPLREHSNWGWRIVNHAHYSQIRSEDDRREYHRQYAKNRKSKLVLSMDVKERVHRLVARAVASGILRPSPCSVCGDIGISAKDGKRGQIAHHDDYSYPYAVRWLCRKHHTDWHRKNGEGVFSKGRVVLDKSIISTPIQHNSTPQPESTSIDVPVDVDIRTKPIDDIEEQCAAIYEIYPRHAARPSGLKAINKAIRKGHTAEFLLQKTREYAAARIGCDKQFTPYPATWFNQHRFNDSIDEWKMNTGKTAKQLQQLAQASVGLNHNKPKPMTEAERIEMKKLNDEMDQRLRSKSA